jgi:glucose/arabinose dehydrogenase
MKTITIVLLLSVCCAWSASPAQDGDYRFEKVVDGIDIPWGMVWLPDGDMLVTERSGQLFRVAEGKPKVSIDGLPELYVNWHAGLLDIELHPDYAQNGWIYIAYASPDGAGEGGNTAIMRARLEGTTLVDQQVLYKASPNSTSRDHYGSRIEFDKNGFLFFSFGDNYNHRGNPQDIAKDGGKIYRLYDNGDLPEDNPFYRQPGARPAVYSYGHRNPQGMAQHPETGQIWVHEHGPQGGDEINIIRAGRNYGWPIISYGIDYDGTKIAEGTHREGMEQPVWQWTPSIAPSGMAFVSGDRYPALKGHLLVGSLKFAYVSLCEIDGENVTCDKTVFENIGRVRNVRQGPDDYIYVAVDGAGIFRILPRGT